MYCHIICTFGETLGLLADGLYAVQSKLGVVLPFCEESGMNDGLMNHLGKRHGTAKTAVEVSYKGNF